MAARNVAAGVDHDHQHRADGDGCNDARVGIDHAKPDSEYEEESAN